jgi:hypothetical protein
VWHQEHKDNLKEDLLEKSDIHEQWEKELICPVYQKGDQLQPNNYRDMRILLNMGSKTFSSVLYERLQLYVEKVVDNLGFPFAHFSQGSHVLSYNVPLSQIYFKCPAF